MIWKTFTCLFAVAVVAVLVLGCGPTEPPADSPVAEKALPVAEKGSAPAKGASAPAEETSAIVEKADEAAVPKIRTPHQYLYVVYFNPAGRRCLPGYRERLDRVMTEVQTWYRDEMERNGFGPMTFPLERDEQGRLIVHVVNGTEPYVYADKNMIHTVLRNLVSNSIKFTPAEGTISIEAVPEQESIHIIVKDNGVGIPLDKQGKLFSFGEFHSTSGTAGEPGTGLGLIICFEFIKKHGGKLSFSSESGKGTSFAFYLANRDPSRNG